MKRALSFLTLITLGAASALSQTDGVPRVVYEKSKPVGILIGDEQEPDFTCRRSVQRSLRLVTIIYEEGSAEVIESLILADERNRREEFLLNLNFNDVSDFDQSAAKDLIGEGLVYDVGAFRCGAGGRGDPQIYSIRIVRKKQR